MSDLPSILEKGERARLFPVLADTSRENRITSILLSVLSQVQPLAQEVLKSTGVRVGKKTIIEAYTEVVLRDQKDIKNRPDGLLIVSTGKTTWRALIESKIGKAKLTVDQVERYLELAKDNEIDAVITISNDFVTRADHSPVAVSKKLLKKTG
jgi:2-phospho-L-lactate guanylyltransferase (CobY/MobA/RfbA family)